MVTGHAIHFDWEIFNVSHPGYVVLIISGYSNLTVIVINHRYRFYRLRNRDWKRCVSREWSVLRAKCILFDARLPGVRTKTLLLYRYRACGGCYSQIKVPDRRQ